MPQSAEHLKEEGWIYQSCGFPLVATAPWGLPGLRSKGRAGAAGPEAHPCMKIFRDPGEKGDQNSGGGREKEGFQKRSHSEDTDRSRDGIRVQTSCIFHFQ